MTHILITNEYNQTNMYIPEDGSDVGIVVGSEVGPIVFVFLRMDISDFASCKIT